jgi:SAM-dependent methyltransferase
MSCLVCRSEAGGTFFLSAGDNLNLTPGKFHLICCPECGLVSIHPLPSNKELKKYYPLDYCSRENLAPTNSPSYWINQLEKLLRHILYQKETMHLKKLVNRGGKILEVGCGKGELLALFKARGYEVYGIELLPELVQSARERFGLEVQEGDFLYSHYPSQFFDLVIFYHVLEHLPQPNLGLLEAKRILKRGGFLLLQLPNILSFQCKIFKGRWFALELPRHLYHFSPKTIKLLLKHAGFELVRLSHFSLRNNPLILASSLFPRLNYHRVQQSTAKIKLLYFLIASILIPFTTLESMVGRGATITITAQSI